MEVLNQSGNREEAAAPQHVIRIGHNAWRQARARQVAFLIDAAAYYRALLRLLPRATRSIWIIGWDFNPEIRLDPRNGEEAVTLGAFLRDLVERNPALEVRILVWDEGPIYSSGIIAALRGQEWRDHPRIHFRFDSNHPLRGSHHQKIVCVDERIAFIGGMDLTIKRWDDREHKARNRLRVTPYGDVYGPVHDVQAILSGEAAETAAEVARRRWKRATGEEPPADLRGEADWPDSLQPAIENCEIAFGLSEPGINGHRRHVEAAELACDLIRAARRHIYIETQYLASSRVTRCLASRLREPDGPELVIVVTRDTRGIFEKLTMGLGRDHAIRRLVRANRHDRLRIGYAVVQDDDGEEVEVLIHSKVIIVDDRFIRVGSSNLNNRSEGFDTECDVAIEATNPACRRAIARLRDDLLSEHAGADRETFSAMVDATGSIVAALDRLNGTERGLRPYVIDLRQRAHLWPVVTGLMDPKRPYWPMQRVGTAVRTSLSRLSGLVKALF